MIEQHPRQQVILSAEGAFLYVCTKVCTSIEKRASNKTVQRSFFWYG